MLTDFSTLIPVLVYGTPFVLLLAYTTRFYVRAIHSARYITQPSLHTDAAVAATPAGGFDLRTAARLNAVLSGTLLLIAFFLALPGWSSIAFIVPILAGSVLVGIICHRVTLHPPRTASPKGLPRLALLTLLFFLLPAVLIYLAGSR